MKNHLITTITPWVRQIRSGQTILATDSEIQTVLNSVLDSYHSLPLTYPEQNLSTFLHIQQQVLADLLDGLPAGTLQQGLVQLWEDLHRYFWSYLNPDTVLPASLLAAERARNAEAWAPLRRQLRRAKVDEGLVALLGEVFQFQYLPDGDQVPVRKVYYLRALWVQLKQLTDSRSAEPLEDRIRQLLLLHNFNAVQFYCWCRDRLLAGVPDELPIIDRLRTYRELLLAHSSVPQLSNRVLVDGLPGICEQLAALLREQVALWEGVLDMTDQLKEQDLLPVRIESKLSVSQLALLFRTFRDYEGTFSMPRPKRFFEFVANHFSSKRADAFQWETFKNDFYVFPTMGDVEVVQGLLKGMSEFMEEQYGLVG